jgi:hypothetical protein
MCTGSAAKTAAIRAMALSGAKILVAIKVFHKGEFDPDGLISCATIILDSLVNVRYLRDDSHDDIKLEVSQLRHSGHPYTEITLEEV